MFRSPFTWLGLIAVVVIAGPWMCSSKPAEPTVAVSAPTAASRPNAPARPPEEPPDVTVSPERLRLSGYSVGPQVLDVSYRIRQPELVTKAWLELKIDSIGSVAQMDVPIQASGSARFDVVPKPHSIGPHVQFRAVCPKGTTEWRSMGSPPHRIGERDGDAFQIWNVGPNVIRWTPWLAAGSGGGGTLVSIFSKQFTPDCRIEAQVDGSPIELSNVWYTGRHFEGILQYKDIAYSAVLPRYAYLNLVLERGGKRSGVSGLILPFD